MSEMGGASFDERLSVKKWLPAQKRCPAGTPLLRPGVVHPSTLVAMVVVVAFQG